MNGKISQDSAKILTNKGLGMARYNLIFDMEKYLKDALPNNTVENLIPKISFLSINTT